MPATNGGMTMESTRENQVWGTESRVRLSSAIATMLRPSTISAEPCTLSSAAVVQAARAQSAPMEAATPQAAMRQAAVVRVAAIGQFRSRLRDDLAVHPMRG